MTVLQNKFPRRNPTAEAFDRVWRAGTYAGFSRNTLGESATPFLNAFIKAVQQQPVRVPRVVELGAGSCDHALRCAHEGFHVTAVEYSRAAVALALQNVAERPHLNLRVLQADIMDFTPHLEDAGTHGVYANSVFHFLTGAQRSAQYAAIRAALVRGGVLAVSFKSAGDALQARGQVFQSEAAGAWVRGVDGIPRLFVDHAEALVAELTQAGFQVFNVLRWSVPSYNIVNEAGEFVGLLARPLAPRR